MPCSDSTCWTVIREAASGDEEARSTFVRTYGAAVRAYLASRWRSSRLAQDLDDAAQEVYLDCFAPGGVLARADEQRPGGFRALLLGVVRNVALRVERRCARDRLREGLPPEVDALAADDTTPSEQFDRAWAVSILREAAARQRGSAASSGPDAARRVELLRLRFEEGLPVRAIAARWGEEVRRVDREYERAREEFREALRVVVALHHPGSPGDVERECRRLLAAFE
jgi:RNA polymerase sigma-70 factor (ECF subfamily)